MLVLACSQQRPQLQVPILRGIPSHSCTQIYAKYRITDIPLRVYASPACQPRYPPLSNHCVSSFATSGSCPSPFRSHPHFLPAPSRLLLVLRPGLFLLHKSCRGLDLLFRMLYLGVGLLGSLLRSLALILGVVSSKREAPIVGAWSIGFLTCFPYPRVLQDLACSDALCVVVVEHLSEEVDEELCVLLSDWRFVLGLKLFFSRVVLNVDSRNLQAEVLNPSPRVLTARWPTRFADFIYHVLERAFVVAMVNELDSFRLA